MRAHTWIALGLAAGVACGPGSKHSEPNPPEYPAPTCAAGEELQTRYSDVDGDGHGGPNSQVLCVPAGAEMPAGYAAAGDDCDDANAGLWQPLPYFWDRDLDGVGEGKAVSLCAAMAPAGYALTGGDCAPDDSGQWQLLTYAFRDEDGDGATVAAGDQVCAGFTLPAGFLDVPGATVDCDDSDAARSVALQGWYDGDLDGYGSGHAIALCTDGNLPAHYAPQGDDCAPSDGARWQLLPYGNRDADGDWLTAPESGSVCSGALLPTGYYAEAHSPDCDDRNRSLGPLKPAYRDVDGDGAAEGDPEMLCYDWQPPPGYTTQPTDCAPGDGTRWQVLSYSYRDADGDGYTVPSAGTLCSGTFLPIGYATTPQRGADCDDTSPTLFQGMWGYLDADRDTFGAGETVVLCTDGTMPAGYVTNATDCAPDDAARWRTVTNLVADRDGDGYTAPEAGSLCIGTTYPDPFRAAANGNDCDEANPSLWRWVVLYPDRDGDGIGAPPRVVQCLGTALPAGFSTAGWDADDGNLAVQGDGSGEDLVLALW